VARFSPGPPGEQERQGRLALRKLVADGRLMLDIFTMPRPATTASVLGSEGLTASEVALHNDEEHGYWMVVNGAVYDVTEFMHLHPGGRRIILEHVGRDATRGYRAVGHQQRPEVDAVLSMYKLGHIRRLDFGGAWGVAPQPSGMASLSLHDLFRAWVRYLYLLVEMQNALRNDFGYLDHATTRGDEADAFSPLKAMLLANTHRRFLASYFDGALGTELTELWASTVGLCAPEEDVRWMERALGWVRGGGHARAVHAFSDQLGGLYQELRRAEGGDAARLRDQARSISSTLRQLDGRFLHDMKHAIRDGVIVFEELEAETMRKGGARLVECLRRVPHVAGAFLASLAIEVRRDQSPIGRQAVG
jgi:cytochrome b involved in lipid metabolism